MLSYQLPASHLSEYRYLLMKGRKYSSDFVWECFEEWLHEVEYETDIPGFN